MSFFPLLVLLLHRNITSSLITHIPENISHSLHWLIHPFFLLGRVHCCDIPASRSEVLIVKAVTLGMSMRVSSNASPPSMACSPFICQSAPIFQSFLPPQAYLIVLFYILEYIKHILIL